MPKPNILFITDDQHRYDHLSMSGRFPVHTPALARLAREGIWHRAAFSPCPLCMPARCSLHTGLYAHQHGMTTNVGHWPLYLPTLPQALQRLGYHTAAIGKLHVYEGVPEALDLTREAIASSIRGLGYDHLHEVSGKMLAWYLSCHWTRHLDAHGLLAAYRAEAAWRSGPRARDTQPFQFPEAQYADAYIGDHCVDWLEQVDTSRQPFFLWAGLVSPHPPNDAPRRLADHYPPAQQPPPIDNDEPGEWPVKRSLYAGMIEMVDHQVGRLLAVLDRRGLLENTLVIFTSDHGEMLGDHGKSGKCFPHDPSTRVPLLARWPGMIQPGSIDDALIEITDLVATCLHVAAGEEQTAQWLPRSPARSLLPLWRQEQDTLRDFIYSEDGGQFLPAYQMIRTPEWKYVLYRDSCRELLFNMLDDPDECANLAGESTADTIRDGLKSRLLAHIANTPPPVLQALRYEPRG